MFKIGRPTIWPFFLNPSQFMKIDMFLGYSRFATLSSSTHGHHGGGERPDGPAQPVYAYTWICQVRSG